MPQQPFERVSIKKIDATGITEVFDALASEAPLEIRLGFWQNGSRQEKSISVTMRTPGNDEELAAGFLFTEGLVARYDQIRSIQSVDENVLFVEMKENLPLDLQRLERHFYTTSSCGVCGKASIDAVKVQLPLSRDEDSILLQPEQLYALPQQLRSHQLVFADTGGLHASALFDLQGQLTGLREDVGRHNALDKLIGTEWIRNRILLDRHILLLSGRASFELIQKAAMAGIRVVAAVGAPSTLAAELAAEAGITLVGFLRDNRFNVYAGAQRILI